jgi:hypothetical protein
MATEVSGGADALIQHFRYMNALYQADRGVIQSPYIDFLPHIFVS